jgi:hypothetical protein
MSQVCVGVTVSREKDADGNYKVIKYHYREERPLSDPMVQLMYGRFIDHMKADPMFAPIAAKLLAKEEKKKKKQQHGAAATIPAKEKLDEQWKYCKQSCSPV